MIEFNLIWLIALLIYASSFLVFIVVNLLKIRKEKDYFSFTNYFPFEFMKKGKIDILLYLFIGLSFLPFIVIFPSFSDMGDLLIFNIVIACVFGLSSLLIGAIYKISTQYLKTHIQLSTFLIAASFLSSALVALHFFLNYATLAKFGGRAIIYLICGIIASLLAILVLVLSFNPKLKNWAQLDVRSSEDGSIISRPKFFSLAYSEWISILIIYLSEILFFISMLSI